MSKINWEVTLQSLTQKDDSIKCVVEGIDGSLCLGFSLQNRTGSVEVVGPNGELQWFVSTPGPVNRLRVTQDGTIVAGLSEKNDPEIFGISPQGICLWRKKNGVLLDIGQEGTVLVGESQDDCKRILVLDSKNGNELESIDLKSQPNGSSLLYSTMKALNSVFRLNMFDDSMSVFDKESNTLLVANNRNNSEDYREVICCSLDTHKINVEKIEDCKKCDREVRLRDGKVGFIGLMNDRNYSFFIWDADIEEFVKSSYNFGGRSGINFINSRYKRPGFWEGQDEILISKGESIIRLEMDLNPTIAYLPPVGTAFQGNPVVDASSNIYSVISRESQLEMHKSNCELIALRPRGGSH